MSDRDEPLAVAVENLGGIRSATVSLSPGVSILTGRNATNRTSLLRAIGAALGGSTGALKADADYGAVTITLAGQEHTRTFERDGDGVRVDGEPYTDESTLVDQYSCLLADNAARRAVERGDAEALRSYIMAPVDTDAIDAEIERIRQSLESLRTELSTAKRERERIPELERRLAATREEHAAVAEELDEIDEAVADYERDADDAAESVIEALDGVRSEYERVHDRLDTQREALDSLRAERDSVRAELEGLSAPEIDRGRLEDEIERLQRRERDLETTVTSLLSIVEFNEQLTDGQVPAVGGGSSAAEIDPGSGTVECWTCGTAVDPSAIDDRLGDLRAVIDEKRTERNELRSTIEARREELAEAREAADRRSELEAELADIDTEITERESRVEELESRIETLRERIAELEAEAADDLRDSDLLENYRRRSELAYERGQLEEQIDSISAALDDARAAGDRVAEIQDSIADREAELEDARTRIEEIERTAVQTFNDHMETVLALLDYGNVERVWIERRVDDGGAESEFHLHVVRATEDDVVYEDTVANLSESEREVIGLVVALAGYLVHDVHETVPVTVLDSLEAIDADRIAALVAYVADFVPYLVVALLPEDAQALPGEYERVEMGGAPV